MRQLIVLCIVAAAIIGALFLSPAFTSIYSVEFPRAVAVGDEFLRYYNRDDAVDIYHLFAASMTAQRSRDASVSELKKQKVMTGKVTKESVSNFHPDVVNGKALFTITCTCTSEKGPLTLTMTMRKETTWKICSYQFTMMDK